MATWWAAIEGAPPAAAALAWRRRLGAELPAVAAVALRRTERLARTVPCPHGCGCGHRVLPVRQGGGFAGVCGCEEPDCDDLALTPEDVAVWELDQRKLGRGVARALGCDGRDADFGLPRTRQVAVFGGAGMPVVLTLPLEADEFGSTVAQLVARLREHFIVLAPTGRFMDAHCHGLLKSARAGFFDLETNLVLTSSGLFQARRSGGELFSPYLPKTGEPASDDEARRMFALLKALESEGDYRKAPVTRVFQLYCLEGLTRDEVATKCRCVPSLVTLRLQAIEKKLGRKASELRQLSGHFEPIAASLTDERARRVHRASALDQPDDDDFR